MEARALTNRVCTLTRTKPLSSNDALCDQLRRAAVSARNNLAEGGETLHLLEKKNGYNYARRSAEEVRSMTCLLLDNQLATQPEIQDLYEQAVRTGAFISGLIRSSESRLK
jgi:four helix bundle protein